MAMFGQNLVQNGNFEEWGNTTPSGWFKGGDDSGEFYQNAEEAVDGDYALEARLPIYNGEMSLRGTNTPGIEPGHTYRYSGWYKKNAEGSLKIEYRFMEDFNGDLNFVGVEQVENNEEWQYFEIDREYTGEYSDVVRVDLYFRNNPLSTQVAYYIDDLQIVDLENLSVSEGLDWENSVQISSLVHKDLTLNLQEKMTVNLYDMSGKLLWSKRISAGLQQISMEQYHAGVYVLQLSNGTHAMRKKIIKK